MSRLINFLKIKIGQFCISADSEFLLRMTLEKKAVITNISFAKYGRYVI